MIRVERGNPSPEEVAVVVAVLAASGPVPQPSTTAPRSLWVQRARNVRPAPLRGPDAWRSSALPR